MMRGCGLAVGLCLLVESGRAAAQPALVRHIVFNSEDTCGTKELFLRQLKHRLPHIREAALNEYAAFIRVATRRVPDRASGKLELVELDGSWSKRELDAANCEELVDGLALIAALILSEGSVGRESATTEPPPVVPQEVEEPPPVSQPWVPRRASEPRRWSWGGGVEALAVQGLFPDLSVGFRANLQGGYRPGSSWEPGARLVLQRLSQGGYQVGAAQADFAWTSGGLLLCPLAWRLSEPIHVGACVGWDAGWIEASGSAIDLPRSETRSWLAASAAAHARWLFLGSWGLELEAGALVPLRRDSYSFDAARFHEVSVVVPQIAVGLAVQFY